MSALALACAAVALPLSVLGLVWRARGRLRGSEEDTHRSDGAWAISNALMVLPWLWSHVYWMAGLSALTALVCAWDWWRKRKRRKRAPRMYGYKARAALAALVRKAREAAQPRPLLRPVPGGAS